MPESDDNLQQIKADMAEIRERSLRTTIESNLLGLLKQYEEYTGKKVKVIEVSRDNELNSVNITTEEL